MKRTHFFTLTELLVVIGIIGILAGVALPVINTAANKGKQTKARTDIHSLEIAFGEFERDFGSLRPLLHFGKSARPTDSDLELADGGLSDKDYQIVTDVNGPGSDKSKRYYDAVMEVLTNTYCKYEDADEKKPHDDTPLRKQADANPPLPKLNPRKKAYFRSKPKKVEDLFHNDEDLKSGYFILDPWGKRYNFAFDYNGNGRIDLSATKKFANEDVSIRGKILIFSYGHAKDDNFKNYVYSWKRR